MSLLLVILSQAAFAGLHGEGSFFYNSDNFTTATTSSQTKMFYGLDLYANLDSKGTYFAGFHIDQVNLQETSGSTTTSLTSLNMGPMGTWLIDRKKQFGLSVGYNMIANGTLTTATGTSTTLTGTGLFASLSVMPEISENLYFGFKLNYYSLSYSRSIDGNSTSAISYGRSLIFPSFSLAWRN